MAEIIKITNADFLNKNEAMLMDTKENVKIKKYDPNNQDLLLICKLDDDSLLNVAANQLHIQYGGQITFDYLDNKYIVDDGYRNVLCKTGYIIMDNYDMVYCKESDKGISMRTSFMQYILDTLKKYLDLDKAKIEDENLNHIRISFSASSYNFIVKFDTVNTIVSKNQDRVKNNLPFYPYDKSVDKYGAIYFSLFAEKKEGVPPQGNRKFDVASRFILRMIEYLNKDANESHSYKFKPIKIERHMVYWEGL